MNSHPECREHRVGVYQLSRAEYSKTPPYDPSNPYPEYSGRKISPSSNEAYDAVRKLLYMMGYDQENFGSKDWNPLRHVIEPGMSVVLKPNFVLSSHRRGKDIYSIITHPSIIRAVGDYCLKAMEGDGRLIIADAPQYDCDWDELNRTTRIEMVADTLNTVSTVDVSLLDLRNYWAKGRHFIANERQLPGDPEGEVIVNLGKLSAFYGLDPSNFYGAVYDRDETIRNHTGEVQQYAVSRTVLGADVLFSLPKLKVHKKVGVTLNQKNMVGICTDKNYLVHYELGEKQFPPGTLSKVQQAVIKFERAMYDRFLAPRTLQSEYIHRIVYGFLYLKVLSHLGLGIPEKVRQLDAGNWHGNDHAWRMATDLALLTLYADKNGQLQNTFQRRIYSIVDGVVGGEGLGPLEPDPHPSRVLLAGSNFLAVDRVATRLMGFNPDKLGQFTKLNPDFDFGPEGNHRIKVLSNNSVYTDMFKHDEPLLKYQPHPGWVGKIEI